MDIQAIKVLLNQDKCKTTNSYKRHPIRFIFMDLNSNTQDDIMYLMQGCDSDFVDLSERVKRQHDGWLTKGEIMEIVNNCDLNKDTFIVGLSEWVRFCSNAILESFVLSLCDFENVDTSGDSGNRRIYFICYSMKEYFHRIIHEKHHRKDVYNPFINEEFTFDNELKEICFATAEIMQFTEDNVIKESQEWLGLWKNASLLDMKKPIICFSEILQEWYRIAAPDNAFQIQVIDVVSQYIEKIFGLNIEFEYRKQDLEYWRELVKYIRGKGPFVNPSAILCDFNGVKQIDEIQLVNKWISSNSGFEKWYIKNFVICYMQNTYLARVFLSMVTESFSEFQSRVWKIGFGELENQLYIQRNNILQELKRYATFKVPEEDIKDIICDKFSKHLGISTKADFTNFDIEKVDFADNIEKNRFLSRMREYYDKWFVKVYSGLSDVEKEVLICLYRNEILCIEEMKDVYPQFYAYMVYQNPNNEETSWLVDYFSEYRKSKVANKDTDDLLKYVQKYNGNAEAFYNWYYSMKRQDVFLKQSDNGIKKYILDGVGGEYVPYITYLLEQNDYVVKKVEYASCYLPSITSINKEKITSYDEWIKTFDEEVVHGEYYVGSHNIRKALSTLEKIILDILSLQIGKDFIICADHGATARAKWTRPNKVHSYSEADHEGRCCNLYDKNVESSKDYILYETDNNWLIALRDVSLNNNPKYEDHGGATIEEVVVPYIHATRRLENKNEITFSVIPIKIKVDGLDKDIVILIEPKPRTVVLVEENGSRHEMDFDGEMWRTSLMSGKQQEIAIFVDENKFVFDVISNASKMIEEDDGFDD